MVIREDDRILYDDSVDEIGAVGRGPLAVALAVLALVAGIIYISWTAPSSGSNKDTLAHETSELTAVPKSGFDASSSDIKACEGNRQAHPDFSIVVAGAAADGQQVVSRVVQFVVVDSIDNLRSERGVQAQSLCTLP